jgi:hypothetical protein
MSYRPVRLREREKSTSEKKTGSQTTTRKKVSLSLGAETSLVLLSPRERRGKRKIDLRKKDRATDNY